MGENVSCDDALVLNSQGVPKKAVTNVRHLEYREVLEEGSERRAACAAARTIAVETVEKKSLSPFNDKVYGLDAHNSRPLGHWRNLEQLRMLGAYAGRLRSARLCALRPRDGVPRGAPASGARSGTAAAAEPLLGVDCRNLKKRKIPSSRFLAFSIMLILIRRSCSKR